MNTQVKRATYHDDKRECMHCAPMLTFPKGSPWHADA